MGNSDPRLEREQVRQLGNAVTPAVMRLLMTRVLDSNT